MGHITEEDSFVRMLLRQVMRLRRVFQARITDPDDNLYFTVRRPLYLINRCSRARPRPAGRASPTNLCSSHRAVDVAGPGQCDRDL